VKLRLNVTRRAIGVVDSTDAYPPAPVRPVHRLLAVVLLLASGTALLAGCGSGSGSAGPTGATLVLDFTPNAVHAGIYSALARGYDRDQGVRLHVIAPSSSTDSIKLLKTGRADFAILDIHDLAIARERGQDVVGIMAIVERPLAAVIAQPQIHNPAQLEGKLAGITGVPSDTAVLDSIVSGAGGDPQRVRTITIGFNAVADLLAARVSAATAFWNDEGVAIRRARPGFHIFKVDAFGAPSYPELVLCATRASLRRSPGLARDVVTALVRGYRFTVAHPAAAAAALESHAPGLDPAVVRAELAALRPALQGAGGDVGQLDPSVLQRWAQWEAKFGIVRRAPDISRTFDRAFLPGSGG
jgi:NitT/TauT family transport system substrate-binding protein/putative hydroxymethylpyrimidine transport system substrate-binding protein